MRGKFLIPILITVFCMAAAPAHADGVIGQAAPVFVATTLDGKPFDLAALKGKVVVVNFWATWCTQCSNELPALEAVWRQYHSKGLEVLAVSADRPRARGGVDQVMHFFSFPGALLGSVSKNELVTLNSVPVTYVIGKDGNVENILTPPLQPLTEAGLGDEVKALLDVKTEAKKEEKKEEPKTDAKP
jgi:peroxiredoxin